MRSFTFFIVSLSSITCAWLLNSVPAMNNELQPDKSTEVNCGHRDNSWTRVPSVMLESFSDRLRRCSEHSSHVSSTAFFVWLWLSKFVRTKCVKCLRRNVSSNSCVLSYIKLTMMLHCRSGSNEASYQSRHTSAVSFRSDTPRKDNMWVTTSIGSRFAITVAGVLSLHAVGLTVK